MVVAVAVAAATGWTGLVAVRWWDLLRAVAGVAVAAAAGLLGAAGGDLEKNFVFWSLRRSLLWFFWVQCQRCCCCCSLLGQVDWGWGL